ncbi:Insulin-like growth factor-binding protein-related protein 1 [Araneus ventricosus]|uniref:Insulin-like growth factor-binding protein-related protein 1 n=1 Tax=Araneus ventricosus TaxID=182803 RepID=A0A4Y2D3J9_ARAVE|nr:Insulin-like growth factor-binding protein-related protein 1 [Araneus ventricosus]
MNPRLTSYLELLCLIFLVHNAICSQNNSKCGACDSSACEAPRNCLAGLVKDSCDCCYVCGNKEGERCEHESVPFEGLGVCGVNLECRARTDLHPDDPPEAVCVCTQQKPMCGSDGVTYDNICQFTEARYSRRDGLRAVSTEPCVQPPRIVSPPQNIRNATGGYAALTCEAKAWPLPTIHWERNKNSKLIRLPGNETRLLIQSQNGPNRDETTSWLLFLSLANEDRGTYICKAENDLGSVTAPASVHVID